MNDFSELENELGKLRPRRPSTDFLSRVEKAMVDSEKGTGPVDHVVRPDRFRINWSIGIGLAAAAVLLLFARVGFRPSTKEPEKIASISPAPIARSTSELAVRNKFIPAGATQVVYHTRDEGLHFRSGSEEPVRRLRSRTRETLQWQNPATGASLRVSYSSERIELIPVSGQ